MTDAPVQPATQPDSQTNPEISVVIPVYNEEAVLPMLFDRLYPVMDALQRSYQIVFVDDGSADKSVALLRERYQKRPDTTHVILLRANFGQHSAIMAGFEHARGHYIITLDADLQNPPEQIPSLLAEMDKGHDYVGTIRDQRQDQKWRHYASRVMNHLREGITNIVMTDQGCMFRGYHRDIINAILDSRESQTFIPALAYLYAGNPTEITVKHEERAAGESKYSLLQLIQLNFDLMTSFSTVPLQVLSLLGMGVSVLSLAFVVLLAIRRLVVGPEAEGVFTLFGIVFFMLGILLFAVGILGEYVGRIYIHVRNRPRFLVRTILEQSPDHADDSKA